MLAYYRLKTMGPDRKMDLINHFKIACALKKISDEEINFIETFCIPILEKHDGVINTDSFGFAELIQSHNKSLVDITASFKEYDEALGSNVSTREAAEYMNCSMRTVQKLAKIGRPHLDVFFDEKKHYRIKIYSINNYLLQKKKVKIN